MNFDIEYFEKHVNFVVNDNETFKIRTCFFLKIIVRSEIYFDNYVMSISKSIIKKLFELLFNFENRFNEHRCFCNNCSDFYRFK